MQLLFFFFFFIKVVKLKNTLYMHFYQILSLKNSFSKATNSTLIILLLKLLIIQTTKKKLKNLNGANEGEAVIYWFG
jgi:hypothetical protein